MQRPEPSLSSAGDHQRIASRRNRRRRPTRSTTTAADGVGDADKAEDSAAADSATLAMFQRLEASPFYPFADCSASLQALLAQERSAARSTRPSASPLAFLIAACHELNALPSVRTQLAKRLKSEIAAVLDKELAAIRDSFRRAHHHHHAARLAASSSGAAAGAGNLSSTSRHDELVLHEICARVFPHLLSILRSHLDAHAQISQCLAATDGQGVAPVWKLFRWSHRCSCSS